MRLVHRQVALLLDDALFAAGGDGLRVTFAIAKHRKRSSNEATVTVYNLSKDRRSQVDKQGTPIALEAGYEEETSLIFAGTVKNVDHTSASGDVITTFVCADDGGATAKRINQSFGKETNVKDVFDAVISELDIDRGNADEVLNSADFKKSLFDYPRGIALYGNAMDELDRLVRNAGYRVSIQDGRLQILRPEDSTTKEIVSLTPSSGLVGVPESLEKGGMRCMALLQPDLLPNDKIRIESNKLTGNYKCTSIRHQGDTHGTDYYTGIEGTPL